MKSLHRGLLRYIEKILTYIEKKNQEIALKRAAPCSATPAQSIKQKK
jgi:hypothetical protein